MSYSELRSRGLVYVASGTTECVVVYEISNFKLKNLFHTGEKYYNKM
jgi:hypothetical protein